MPEWYGIEPDGGGEQTTRLLAAWPDAPTLNVEVCGYLLDVARDQVIEYAPAAVLAPGEDGQPVEIPTNLVLAQLRQAENLWNAGRVSGSGDMGVDTFTFTPRPLDKTIRQIIRPVSSFSNVL